MTQAKGNFLCKSLDTGRICVVCPFPLINIGSDLQETRVSWEMPRVKWALIKQQKSPNFDLRGFVTLLTINYVSNKTVVIFFCKP